MNVSPNELRKQTVATLREVNDILKNYEEGDPSRAPLLLAKSQCLNTLVLLNEAKR